MEGSCMIDVSSVIWCSRYRDDIIELNGDVIWFRFIKIFISSIIKLNGLRIKFGWRFF